MSSQHINFNGFPYSAIIAKWADVDKEWVCEVRDCSVGDARVARQPEYDNSHPLYWIYRRPAGMSVHERGLHGRSELTLYGTNRISPHYLLMNESTANIVVSDFEGARKYAMYSWTTELDTPEWDTAVLYAKEPPSLNEYLARNKAVRMHNEILKRIPNLYTFSATHKIQPAAASIARNRVALVLREFPAYPYGSKSDIEHISNRIAELAYRKSRGEWLGSVYPTHAFWGNSLEVNELRTLLGVPSRLFDGAVLHAKKAGRIVSAMNGHRFLSADFQLSPDALMILGDGNLRPSQHQKRDFLDMIDPDCYDSFVRRSIDFRAPTRTLLDSNDVTFLGDNRISPSWGDHKTGDGGPGLELDGP